MIILTEDGRIAMFESAIELFFKEVEIAEIEGEKLTNPKVLMRYVNDIRERFMVLGTGDDLAHAKQIIVEIFKEYRAGSRGETFEELATRAREYLKERMEQKNREAMDPNETLSDELLRDLLLLVGYNIPPTVISGWLTGQREAAEKWASAAHLHASDQDVEVPDFPEFLEEFIE